MSGLTREQIAHLRERIVEVARIRAEALIVDPSDLTRALDEIEANRQLLKRVDDRLKADAMVYGVDESCDLGRAIRCLMNDVEKAIR